MSEPKDKAEVKERPKKPPGFRNFEKILKQVIKAPPMKRKAIESQSCKSSPL
jgi:hypothetical protein